jgi:hypothetical protein
VYTKQVTNRKVTIPEFNTPKFLSITSVKASSSGSFVGLFFCIEDGGDIIFRHRAFSELHGVTTR